MKHIHESNRACWNGWAKWWGRRRDKKGVWRKCHRDPTLVLSPGEMQFLGDVAGKDVCVLASGDNEVVFALAGMGANVTSVDISEGQLEIAEERARILGLEITFLRSDVADLAAVEDGTFDAVHTGGGVAVWISDLRKYHAEAVRILKPGGVFVVNEFHPMRVLFSDETPWDQLDDYSDRGPFTYTTNEGFKGYEHHWTVADHINAMLAAGCDLLAVQEHDGAPADRAQEQMDEREGLHNDGMKTTAPKIPKHLLIVGRKRSAVQEEQVGVPRRTGRERRAPE